MPNICPHCGGAIQRAGAAFCPACGQSLPRAAAVPYSPPPAPQGPSAGPPTVAGAAMFTPAAHLVIQEPGQPQRAVALTGACATVGRDPACTIVIQNPAVSRHHAEIDLVGREYRVRDLGSTNGTSVNGRPLSDPQGQRLADNDIIRIGDQRGNTVGLTFRTQSPGLAASARIDMGPLNLQGVAAYTMGRDPASNLHLAHPSVSRHHARVEPGPGGGYILRDLGSANGTFVNGALLRGAARPLQPGDIIQIGPYKIEYGAAGLTQYAPTGNYRLDGLRLTRSIRVAPALTDRLLHGAHDAHKLILNDVSISIYPKEFVALVGGSGAGKSTLMNALSGFIPAEGQVLVNGDDLYTNFAAYRSTLGYVPQDDIIHGQLPARVALTYVARLRLPDATDAEISQRVNDALAQVEMTEHADKPVNRLSGGQRKRVSIAAELLADPGLFFLDEPTSGLDPGLEKKMMYTLRRLADSGRTIILVTHATANIDQCTHVAFMADGRLCYFGPPADAKKFFNANDFSDIYTRLSQPLDPVNNPPPPGWSLAPGQKGSASEAWEQCFRASADYQQFVRQRSQAAAGGAPAQRRPAPRQKVSTLQQYAVLTRRYFELIRRDRLSLFILLAVMPIIGILLLMMANTNDLIGKPPDQVRTEVQQEISDSRDDEDPDANDERFQGSYAVAGSAQKILFMLALASSLLGTFAAAYEIVKEEPIYRRERMVNLEILPYLLSKFTVLGGFALVQCLLLLTIIGSKVTLPGEGLFAAGKVEMYLTLVFAALAGVALGLFVSALVRASSAVIYVVLLILFVQIMFAGAIFELPAATKPISYMTPTRWALEALGSTTNMEQLRDMEATCIEFEDQRVRRMFNDANAPCDEGQMRQLMSYTFNVDYRHAKGPLLLRWIVLLLFPAALIALTWYVQKRKDVV